MMVIVIVHRSAGNDSIGSMWHETFEFNESATLKEVLDVCSEFGEDIIISSRSRHHKIKEISP